MRCKLILIGSTLISTVLLSSPSSARNEWLKWTPESGVAIRQGNSIGWNRSIASNVNGDGASAIVWEDTRAGCRNIALQILEPGGTPRFEAEGRLLLEPAGSRLQPSITPGPDDTWFIVWVESFPVNEGKVCGMQIDRDGLWLWRDRPGGVEITSGGSFDTPLVFRDDSDGILVVWRRHSFGESRILAQRLRGDGSRDNDWPGGGLILSQQGDITGGLRGVSDGEGGAFLIWQENNGANERTVVQHITSPGQAVWNNGDPLVLNETPLPNHHYDLIPDGTGGAILAWTDMRAYPERRRDIYAQRLDAAGRRLWGETGSPIANSDIYEQNPKLVSSGEGEAIVVWEIIGGGGGDIDLRAMKIGGEDRLNRLWDDADGVEVVSAGASQWEPGVCADGSGGAMIIWTDLRNGEPRNESDLYIQHLSADGEAIFGEAGYPFYRSAPSQRRPRIIPDGNYFIAIWWEGDFDQCYGLMSQPVDNQGDPIEDPLDIVTARGGSAWQSKTIMLDTDLFMTGWQDSWIEGNPRGIYIRSFDNKGDRVEPVGARETLIPAPENTRFERFELIPVGGGDAIIVLQVSGDDGGSVIVHKVNRAGVMQWGEEGVFATTRTDDISRITVAPDDDGGVFIGWLSYGEPDFYQRLRGQYLSPEGERLWGDQGILLVEDEVESLDAIVQPDGEGGAIYLWREVDLNANPYLTVLRAQRIAYDGSRLWGDQGAVFMAGSYNCYDLQLVRHDLGYVIGWTHSYLNEWGDEFFEIRMQMLTFEGEPAWDLEGISLASDSQYRGGIDIAVDAENRIWVSWHDMRRDQGRAPAMTCFQIIDPAHVVDRMPELLLEEEGRNLTPGSDGQFHNCLTADNLGGMWFVWSEYTGDGTTDLRALHLKYDGEAHDGWDISGMAVCGEAYSQLDPQCFDLNHGRNGIVAIWSDERSSVNGEGGLINNIYCQRIDDGTGLKVASEPGGPPTGFEIMGIYPNPFNSVSRLDYRLGSASVIGVQVFDANGRLVFGVEQGHKNPGIHSLQLNASGWGSGEYIARIRSGNSELARRLVMVK